jgi:hypothetical protein
MPQSLKVKLGLTIAWIALTVLMGVLCNLFHDDGSFWINDFKEHVQFLQMFYWFHFVILVYQCIILDMEGRNKLNSKKMTSSYYWRAYLITYLISMTYFLIVTEYKM